MGASKRENESIRSFGVIMLNAIVHPEEDKRLIMTDTRAK